MHMNRLANQVLWGLFLTITIVISSPNSFFSLSWEMVFLGVWQSLLFYFITIFGLIKLRIVYVFSNCWYFHLSINASTLISIKHLPPNDVLCICMWVCAFKCIFLYVFSNTNAIYDRHIVQACWKHSRRPLRRGVSPSLLVSIFYSKSLINLKIK